MNNEGNAIYLYCLAREESIPVIGELARQGLSGVDERYPVSSLERDGLVAVIGETTLVEFHEGNLRSLDWLAPRAWRHEQVVEAVMRVSPVLPVKFGTIFESRTNLADFLSRHAETISCGLDALRGKTEWTVKGYLDEDMARLRISEETPEISSRLAQLPVTPGARYLAQKKIDALIAAELDSWSGQAKRAIHEALADAAAKTAELNFSPRSEGTEPLVFNLGFLVPDDGMRNFCLKLDGQRRLYGEHGLRLELHGPWPPHHFCTSLTHPA
ncbi:MAG: GvpL/GvpF family gas vesicle protein [Burkholderiales bacterium]|nr:GvpL/GvpF family gas vesicle protein [Burkholderiales bacterium]